MASVPLLVAVGCLNVDLVAQVPALPERDSRLMSQGFARQLGGMACNVAAAAAALGPPWPVRAELIAPVGADPEGAWVTARLAARRVHLDWLERDPAYRTALCVILVEPGGERTIISQPTRLDYARIGARVAAADDYPGAKLLHVDGFHAPGALPWFKTARQAGWRTALDVDELPAQYLNWDYLTAAAASLDVIFINRRCARTLAPADWRDRLQRWATATNTVALLTQGRDGVLVLQPDGPAQTLSGHAVPVLDTTGAGDVFAGVFLACWLHDLAPLQAARYANAAAALATTAAGAQGLLPAADAAASLVLMNGP